MDFLINKGFQSIVRQIQDGLFLIQNERIIYANAVLCNILNYSESEILGKKFDSFVSESDRHMVRSNHERRIRGEKIAGDYEFRILRKDGSERKVSLHVGFTPDNKTIIGTIKDLSQIDETVKQMEFLKQNLEQIIRKLPDIYYRTDMQGILVRLSPSVKDILGYEIEEALGNPITNYYVNSGDRTAIVQKIFEAKGDVVRVEAPLVHKNGKLVWFSTNAYLVYDNNGAPLGIEGLARDDTVRKNLETVLERNRQELVTSRNDLLRMSEFTRRINESMEMDEIVDQILKFASEEFKLEGAAIFLVNSEKSHLDFYRGYFAGDFDDLDLDELPRLRICLNDNQGIHSRVFTRKRPLFLRHFRNDISPLERPAMEALKLQNLLIQPLTIKDECIGLMDFTRFSSPFRLTGKDRQKISAFADQIVSAIRNSRLIKEVLTAKDLMDEEVSLARKIQEHFIADRNYSESIAALYRPMMAVGGDFYQIIRFQDSEEIGIFMSDVSGHGVPAAFITAILKTILLQSEEEAKNPGKFFLRINSSLQKLTMDHFVTVFYCILDPVSRKITYANAGHNFPFWIHNGSIHELNHERSIPLGILSTPDLNDENLEYLTHTMVLPPNTRLFFYTDGLIEATPIDSHSMYHDMNLKRVLLENRNKPPDEYLQTIMSDLIEFRKNDRFEDDICMICVDI